MESIFDSILNSKDATERKREIEDKQLEENDKRNRLNEEEEDIDEEEIDLDEISPEEIEKMLAEADKMEAPRLDVSGIKQVILELEKIINENQRMRVKYATDPLKFEDSEYALHDQIKKCSFFATESKIYPTLVKLDFIGTLSYLLVHDNIVISTDVIKLLDDLTDDETILMDASGEAVGLIDAVIAANIPQTLVSNLSRLQSDSSVHEEGFDATLNIFDHLIEVHPEVLETLWSTNLLEVLLQQLEKNVVSDISLHCSELLFSMVSYRDKVDQIASKPVSPGLTINTRTGSSRS